MYAKVPQPQICNNKKSCGGSRTVFLKDLNGEKMRERESKRTEIKIKSYDCGAYGQYT